MRKEIAIIILIAITILILGFMITTSWQKIEQTRTMFEFGTGNCSMDKSWMPVCK